MMSNLMKIPGAGILNLRESDFEADSQVRPMTINADAEPTLRRPAMRILMLEDSESDAELVKNKLLGANISFIAKRVETKKAFLEALTDFSPDVILADYSLPQFSAPEALRLIREMNLHLPFILVTGSQSEPAAAACIKDGADDYIMKESLVRLPSALRNAIAKKQSDKRLTDVNSELRTLSENLQKVREEERTKIAREIHDELGQTLTALRMDIAWLEGRVSRSKKNVRDKVRSIDEIVGSTIHQVQRIAAGLRPPILDDLGFRAAAEWQAQEFERRSGIRCNFVAGSEEFVLDEQRSTALYRILQEAMTNVSRHAQASTIDIQLDADENNVIMTIKDNGKGITQSEIERIQSLGILGMRERAFLVGGEVCITGSRFKGTQVRVRIPRSVEATEKQPGLQT